MVNKNVFEKPKKENQRLLRRKQLGKSTNMLYNKIFLESLAVQTELKQLEKVMSGKRKDKDYDEGLKNLKATTQKKTKEDIYEIVLKKQKMNYQSKNIKILEERKKSLSVPKAIFLSEEVKNTFLQE